MCVETEHTRPFIPRISRPDRARAPGAR
jgi:hypothetical protein